MNDNNDVVKRALEQARAMQKNIGEAVNKQHEAMKPLIEQSVKNAQDLQNTLTKHAQESSALTQEQTQRAMGHLQNFMRIGADAMRSSAEQMRAHVQQMADQSKAAADSTAEAVGKKPDDVKP
jgi:DNA-directed RNA polymerase subunit F